MATWAKVGPLMPEISVDIGFASDPADDTPTWTSVTSRLRQYHARLYRQTELDEFQTGEFYVVLDNRDRELEPGYAGSTLYPNVKPRKRIRVQARLRPTLVGSGSAGFTATRSPVVTKPTGTLNGDLIIIMFVTESAFTLSTPALWTLGDDIVADISDAQGAWIYKIAATEAASWTFTNLFAVTESGQAVVLVYRGVDQTTPIHKKAEGSTVAGATSVSGPSVTPTIDGCTIVQLVGCDPDASAHQGTPDTSPVGRERYDAKDAGNNSYVFVQDYWQETAAAVALDATGLTAGRYLEFQAALAPAVYDRCGGFIRSIPVTWPGQKDSTVTITAADYGMALNRAQVTIDAFPEELVTARIGRVLDAIGVPAGDRDLDTGTHMCAAIPALVEGAQPATVGALEHIRQVALSDGGYAFSSRDGKITFHNRQHRRDIEATSLITFGDAEGEAPYRPSLVAAMDDARLWNRAAVITADLVREEAVDTTSETANWPSRRDDFQSVLARPGEAAALASLFVWRYADPLLRFPQIAVSCNSSDIDTSMHAILTADVGTRFTLKRRPPGGGAAIDQEVHVEGITEDVVPGSWEVTYDVSSAEPDTSFWVLGTSALNSTAIVGY